MNKTILTLAVAALLAGCSLAPTYQRPDSPVAAAWPQGEAYKPAKTAADAKPASEIAWQDFIGDQQLREVVELVQTRADELRVACAGCASTIVGIPARTWSAAGV